MKKIVVLYPSHYEQSSGGAEIQLKYLVEACTISGFEVHYIYEEKGVPIANKVKAILHPLHKKRNYKFCGKGWFLYRDQILKELNNIKPDSIYTRLGSSWVGIVATYAKLHNIKHIHALASDIDVSKQLFHKPYYPLFSQIETYCLNRGLKYATTIIAQNDYQQECVRRRFHNRIVLVNQMTPRVKSDDVVKLKTKIRIVWIANFKKIKRPEVFVRLAKSLTCFSDRIEMIMCGRMPEKYKFLEDDINKIAYMNYQGELTQEQVFKLLSSAHVLINTSSHEGFSNTFVQAWMRKVVVVSMNSNPNNILTEKNIGYFTPTFDELLKSVLSLIEDPHEIQEKAEASYLYALNFHALENNIDKIINLL